MNREMFEYLINKEHKLDLKRTSLFLYNIPAFKLHSFVPKQMPAEDNTPSTNKPFKIKKKPEAKKKSKPLSTHVNKNRQYIKELEQRHSKENEKPSNTVRIKRFSQKDVNELINRLATLPKTTNNDQFNVTVQKPLTSVRPIKEDNYNSLMKRTVVATYVCNNKIDYCRLNKLSLETKLFYFNSNDVHISTHLKLLGYHQITSYQYMRFADFVYEYKDDSHIYNQLPPHMVYNHFKGNRQLTCKN